MASTDTELPRFWIALTYAHGQRFMVPHPSRQWCFNKELGTHWYQAPIEEYAPLYGFIRENAAALDGFRAREDVSVDVPATVLCKVRSKGSRVVLHAVNLAYDREKDRMREARDVTVAFPASLAAGRKKARVLAPGTEPVGATIAVEGEKGRITIPKLRVWALVVLD